MGDVYCIAEITGCGIPYRCNLKAKYTDEAHASMGPVYCTVYALGMLEERAAARRKEKDCANRKSAKPSPTQWELSMAAAHEKSKPGRKAYDLHGKRFGKLTAVESPRTGYWCCVCDCGNETEVRTGNLTSADIKSCGCGTIAAAKSEKNIKRLKKANTRAGKRKCRRCKHVWYRKKGEAFKDCPDCRSRCSRCNVKLTPESDGGKGKKYICKACCCLNTKMTQGNKGFKQRDYDLMRNYGITVFEYEWMLEEQGGVCFICQQPPGKKRLSVDHKHQKNESRKAGLDKRGKVRGLLCWQCNAGLGKYHDDPNRLARAATYLRTPPAEEILSGIDPEKEMEYLDNLREQEEAKHE